MVEELTVEDQEIAARTSYTYWVAATTMKDCPTEGMRMQMAMREACRHLDGQDGNYNEAMEFFKRAIQFRKERQIDLLRTCFSNDSPVNVTDDQAEIQADFCAAVQDDLAKQVMLVRGHDREKRALMIKMGRTTSEMNEDSYFLAQIYLTERALAATEVISKGKQDQMVAIFDFGTYSSSNSPPFKVVMNTVKTLQRIYQDRLKKLFILDPPFWMRGVYTMLHPFLSPRTREKVNMPSGMRQKESILSDVIDVEQAMPFMLADGNLTSEIEIERFLRRVPFHALYDDNIVTQAY